MLPTIAFVTCVIAVVCSVLTIAMQIFGPKTGLESLAVGLAVYLDLLLHAVALPVVGISLFRVGFSSDHLWIGYYFAAAGLHIGLTYAYWCGFWPWLVRGLRRLIPVRGGVRPVAR